MSGQEISILEYALEDCEGNLTQLQKEWCSVPKIDHGVFFRSRGKVENILLNCFDAADCIQTNMADLLTNTIEFFEHTGVQFSDADAAAAKDIQQVT